MAPTHLRHENGPQTLSPTTSHSDFIIDNDNENDDICVFNLMRKTPLQLQILENLYSDDNNPPQSRMEDYASGLGLSYEQVRRWFVERCQRDKRDAARSILGVGGSGRSTAKGKSKMMNKKKLSSLVNGDGSYTGRQRLMQDMLYSPDYIFEKIFRNDGPPLGVEFDPLHDTVFHGHHDIADSRCCETACPGEQRALKKRKVTKPAILDPEQLRQSQKKTPLKKHGKGKGLMSIWQLINSHAPRQEDVEAFKRGKTLLCQNSQPGKRHGMGKGFMAALQLAYPDSRRRTQKRKPTQQRRRSGIKVLEKKKPVPRRRMVESVRNETQKAHRDCCKIALDLANYDGNLCSFPAKADDEELELRELQAGPNPLTCGAHFATVASNGCSLCKGLLPKFPPDSVRMKKPLCMHPWNSSLELEKKLFKVFQFLYTYGVILDLCPFTLDEFANAFHDKDSSLLGKLHLCLLGLLLSDIEKEISNGFSIHSNKNVMFLNLIHTVEAQDFVVSFWKTSLNPLTWTEILRQVLVAAGFGSKDGNQSKGCFTKETDHMAKYGLNPNTLKGKIFSILFEKGNEGMKVTELAKSSQIVDLNLGLTNDKLEDSICSILASDITLFEKISPSAYRLRLTSIMKKDEDALSDHEDCGSVDDGSRVSSVRSMNGECNSGTSSLRLDLRHQSPENIHLSLSSVIDESLPGESWLLGLMEGEYSDLSIEEKLNVIMALVDLVSAGSTFRIRMEDPSVALAGCVPGNYQYGSGGKIKRSTVKGPSLFTSYSGVDSEVGHTSSVFCAVDSAVVLSMICEEHTYSGKKKGSNGTGNGIALHPVQSIFLGSDRRYNRYWVFLGPCDAEDPGHNRVYVESSEDGHWQVIDNEEALCSLLATLNGQGKREAVLLASLEKRMTYLLQEMLNRVSVDASFSQSSQSGLSEIDGINQEIPSPISDVDNLLLGETSFNAVTSSGAAPFKVEKKAEEQKQMYERLQVYDSWIWNDFYSKLHAVRHGKWSFYDTWTRCGSCHDLYWRYEKHCKTCHMTFELNFDLEEKYAIHVTTCHASEDADVYPMHKVLPSTLQALKAAILVIELILPEDALIGAWKKSAHKLWVRRLRRTSSLRELLQVLGDFVGSLNVDWVPQCNIMNKYVSPVEDFVAQFQNMPQTSSAVALWLVKLDALIALQSDEGDVAETA